MIADNENASNILKLTDSPIIHPETPSLLVMLPISRSTKLKCRKKRRRLSASINQVFEFPNRKYSIHCPRIRLMASSKEDMHSTETLFISDLFFPNKKFLTWLYFSDGFFLFLFGRSYSTLMKVDKASYNTGIISLQYLTLNWWIKVDPWPT